MPNGRPIVMTAAPQHPSAPDPSVAGGEDPTRDIRLPMIPGRPTPGLPAGWAASPTGASSADPVPETAEELPASAEESRTPAAADQRTDELPAPPARPRERTLAFSSPEMSQRPVRPVQVGRSPRRWPWVVLTLLPILVIVGAGITFLLLLRGG